MLTAGGASIRIEDVEVGDQVMTTDPATGREFAHRVTRLYRHEDQAIFEVEVGGGTVAGTRSHPFWVEDRGWVEVDQLRVGDRLVQPDGSSVAVGGVRDTGRRATVFNFEVEGVHDYYVRVGQYWVLVHNTCETDGTPAASGSESPAAKTGTAATRALTYGTKIEGQMATRGWTQEAIQATVDNPTATHSVWDLTSGTRQAATAYVQRGGGYVVVNEESGAVVQISNLNKAGWKPVWEDPRFIR